MLTNRDIILLWALVKENLFDVKQFYGNVETEYSSFLIKQYEELADKLFKLMKE